MIVIRNGYLKKLNHLIFAGYCRHLQHEGRKQNKPLFDYIHIISLISLRKVLDSV
jgi:hypothetical protein